MVLALFSVPTFVNAQVPEWIWHSNAGKAPQTNEVRFFRKKFTLDGEPKRALLSVAADDEAEVWVNGKKASTVKGWNAATTSDVTYDLHFGENILAIRAKNDVADAGLLVRLEMTVKKKGKETIASNKSWSVSAEEQPDWQKLTFFQGTNWTPAASRGAVGVEPWGDILKTPKATPADQLTTLPGFKVELMHSAQTDEGSWICMTVDPKGRLIISPQQDNLPLWRVTVSGSKIVKKEAIPAPIHQAMGLCWAHDSLYVNAHGPNGTGLYRLIDANHNDRFDTNEVHFLKTMKGEGEHGYHAVTCGPDGMIYVMNGNHTKLPDGIVTNSPHQHYDEDFLLPRQWDAGGHAVGILAPGGQILRTDPQGKKWELVLAGFRNSYDFDFNKDGEIFTFDSDMEWEWGMWWYRPTRIIHCVTGGEYGWRSGSGKWPEYYPDSLPAALDLAIGSPTGTKFGTKAKFPAKYQRAFYAMDWSYGRIFAVHLMPHASTYDASSEVFIKGKPLNVTDLEFGKDGAMYFITGGRNTQSGLYRVTYTGKKVSEPRKTETAMRMERASANARALRRLLESFDGKRVPGAVDVAWPHLGDDDRFLRYAARVAIESQDVAQWKDRAINEGNPQAGLNALLALARVGGKETQKDLLMALKKFPFDSLSDDLKLQKLRVIELSFIRQGKPEGELAKLATEKLDRQYPSTNQFINRELCQLLIYLEAPNVLEKTMALLDKAPTQEEQIAYIFHLRNLKNGWSTEQRKKYFEWFNQDFTKLKHPPELMKWFADAGRDYQDGASFAKQLANMKKDAIATLSESEKLALGDLIMDPAQKAAETKPAKERKFVREWKMGDLEGALDQVASNRNFENGRSAFNDAQCIKCHRFGNEGGSVGPELTAAASKYSRRDILDSILEPSKVVSEQFQNETVVKKDGEDYTGRVVDEKDDKLVLAINPLAPDQRVEVKKADIASRKPSKLSPMPEGLLNNLSKEDILDLLAYIESMGKAKAPNFSKESASAKK